MFNEPALLEHEDWQEFEHELRQAFDSHDGIHFGIILMRLQNLVGA